MIIADDFRYMAHALQMARRGLYTAAPNPRVGCLIVREGTIVGAGWHRRTGDAHAEVHALAQAGERARSATAYVTLEPCCHHGRTPPCTDARISAGVKRVVAAMTDPNPLVAGQGLQQLKEAGLDVEQGVMEIQAAALNAGFIRRMRHGRPFVRCKLAMSLDGRTAMASKESKWITGAAARHDVQRLRASSCAILTGVGTVLADDPLLTVRWDKTPAEDIRQPLRVVLDSSLRMSPKARLLSAPGQTLVCTTITYAGMHKPLLQAGAEIKVLTRRKEGVDVHEVMSILAQREINEVLVEAGARVSGALLRAGLIDELVIYMAPQIMGDQARGLFHLPGLTHMAQRLHLHIKELRNVGDDWRITATVAENGTAAADGARAGQPR